MFNFCLRNEGERYKQGFNLTFIPQIKYLALVLFLKLFGFTVKIGGAVKPHWPFFRLLWGIRTPEQKRAELIFNK